MKYRKLTSLLDKEWVKGISKIYPDSLLLDSKGLTGIRKEIFQRATHVAYTAFLLGVIIIFRTIYIVIIYRYKYGLIQEDIRQFVNLDSFRFVTMSTVLSLGVFLFKLKQKRQILYGLIETGFAIATSYTLVDNLQKVLLKGKADILVFFPIMTSLYLIVRGLSNVSDGIKKSTEKINKKLASNDQGT